MADGGSAAPLTMAGPVARPQRITSDETDVLPWGTVP